MKGIIVINSYNKTEEYLYQPERLKSEFAALGVGTEILTSDKITAVVGGKVSELLDGVDFCVFLDKDKYLLSAIERAGIKTFNGYYTMTVCDDKAETYFALSGAGIPVPKTVAGLLCYTDGASPSETFLDGVEKTFGYPVVVKECYGSLGKEVYLVKNREELEKTAVGLIKKPHLYQEFIAESRGRDVRVIVVGGKAIGAMKRTSKNDFRSNVAVGGKGEVFPLAEVKDIAERAAKAVKADYCGVDLLFGKHGFTVCEVNSNAFFGGFERTTKIDVALSYAAYVISETNKKRRDRKTLFPSDGI